MKRFCGLLVGLATIGSAPTEGQEKHVVFEAIPTAMASAVVDGGFGGSPIPDREGRVEATIRIIWDGTFYRWETRDNRILCHTHLGAFHHFYSPGSGWVKIFDAGGDTLAAALAGIELGSSPVHYFEVLTIGLTTITYFGDAKGIDIPALPPEAYSRSTCSLPVG